MTTQGNEPFLFMLGLFIFIVIVEARDSKTVGRFFGFLMLWILATLIVGILGG